MILAFCVAMCPAFALGQAAQLRTQEELLTVIEGKTTTLYDAAKAFQELAIVGDASIAPRVARFLKVPEMSTYVLTALQRIPGEQVDQVLIDELGKLEGPTKVGVLHALGERRTISAIEAIEKLAKDNDDQETRFAAIRALGRIGGDEAKKSLKRCRNAATTPHETRLVDAAIAEAFDGEPTIGRIQFLIQSKDQERVREAFSMARQLGKKANKLVANQLKSKARYNQLAAIMFLGDNGDSSNLEKLRTFLKSSDSELCLRAFQSLIKLGDYGSTSELPVQILSRNNIGLEAATSLSSIDNEDLEAAAVRKLMASASNPTENDALMQSLIRYAALRRLPLATQPLLTVAKSSKGDLRSSALDAIGSTVSAEQFPGLLKEISRFEQFADAQTVLETACSRLPQKSTALAIEQALQNASPEQLRIMFQLRTLGGPEALRVVAKSAQSGDDHQVDIATQVLGEWMTADVAEVLLPLARELKGKYQLRALRGYLRVGRQLDMPESERLKLCQTGYELAERIDEKLLVLDILRRRPSQAGYEWLQSVAESKSEDSAKLQARQNAVISFLSERYGS